MSVNYRKVLTIMTVFLFVLVCCVSTIFGQEVSRNLDQEGEDDEFANEREIREYDQKSWHIIQNTPDGSSGWVPRDTIDSQSGVVSTKRRRLRKRKRRPPVVSFVDEGLEDILQPTKKFGEETENHNQNPEAPRKYEITGINNQFRQDEFIKPKRRKGPNVREPWEEMQEESVRPYVRRKVTPAYQASEEIGIITSSNANLTPIGATIQFDIQGNSNSENETSQVYYGKPKTTKKKEQQTIEKSENSKPSRSTTTPNLKAILKQNGGLSLSEILQQKNLTLSELLMGNQDAIKALTESSADIVPSSTPNWNNNFSENLISSTQRSFNFKENFEVSKYKRLPPSVVLKKENINRKYEQYGESHESLSDKELLQAQRRRLTLLQGHSYKNAQNGKFSEVTRYDVITEPTTEKRIFVPSHPKLYTSIDYKPELSQLTETRTEPYTDKSATETSAQTTTSTTTQRSEITTQHNESTKAVKPSFTKPKFELPITSVILNKMVPKRVLPTKDTLIMEEEKYPMPFKPLKVDIKDVLAFLNSENEPEEKVSDEPFRMSIDLDTILEKSTSKPATEVHTTNIPLTSTTTSTITSTSNENITKPQPFSAKDEILEILKDSTGRERLAKILEARNMTIQELIDQRERGSSQLHLADIFHNKTKEPEPSEEAYEGRISSEVFTSFPVFVRQPKALFQKEITTQKFVETTSQTNNIVITAFPSFKIEVPKELPKDFDKSTNPFPWKQLYPDLFNVQDKNKKETVNLPVIHEVANRIESAQNKGFLSEILEEDIQRLDELDQRLLSSVSSERLNTVDEDTHKIIKIPSGVQSAIVASMVIVGLSFIVFMTILVIFRWMQKQRTKFKYCDSLKPPLFDVKPQNIKTFVTETLGKSNFNYYKNNFQSMGDNVWERDSNRKSSF